MSNKSELANRVGEFFATLRKNAKTELTEEEVKRQIIESIKVLKDSQDFTSQEIGNVFSTLMYLQHFYAMGPDSPLKMILGSMLFQQGYGELFVKMATSLEGHVRGDNFDEKSQPVYNLFVLCSGFLNFTDHMEKLGRQFAMSGGVPVMMRLFKNLIDQLKESGTEVNNQRLIEINNLILTIIGVLTNCYSTSNSTRPSRNRHLYRQENVVDIFESHIHSSDVTIRVALVLILSEIADEKFTERITKQFDCILLLVQLLGRAQKFPGRNNHVVVVFGKGVLIPFPVKEVLKTLYNLAVNDDNKVAIQKCGGIPLVLRMTRTDLTIEERLQALRLIWRLLFVDSIKRDHYLQENVDVFHRVFHELAVSSQSFSLRITASHVLWLINNCEIITAGSNLKTQEPLFYLSPSTSEDDSSNERKDGPYVLISLFSESQNRALFIKDQLTQQGYKVRMDESILMKFQVEELTAAVEGSEVVLICVTENYKRNTSCRSEASYARKMGKPFIPLLMDKEYTPDGWLEKLMGPNAKYHQFCTDEDMDTNIDGLVADIGDRGKTCATDDLGNRFKSDMKIVDNVYNEAEAPAETATEDRAETPAETLPEVCNSPNIERESFCAVSEKNVRYWSYRRVETWLEENDLADVDFPSYVQGNQLILMHEHHRKTDEKFQNVFQRNFRVSSATVLKFTTALEKLISQS